MLKAFLLGLTGAAGGLVRLERLVAAPGLGRWHQLDPKTAPSPRAGAALAYDAARGVPVLFSGRNADADTWTWDGLTWVHQNPPVSPPARYGASFAYHPPTKTTVLFSGSGLLGDTWLWNGRTWRAVPGAGPPARSHASMAFDPTTESIVLFGGHGSSGELLNDTWKWDGKSWRVLSPRVSPPPTAGDGFAYSATAGKLILFGGHDVKMPPGGSPNTWAWDGQTWSPLFFDLSPSSRAGAAMAADPAGRMILLFGGVFQSYLGDTWILRSTWSPDTEKPAPSPRTSASLAPDPSSKSFLLFGGATMKVGTLAQQDLLGDTWAWGPY